MTLTSGMDGGEERLSTITMTLSGEMVAGSTDGGMITERTEVTQITATRNVQGTEETGAAQTTVTRSGRSTEKADGPNMKGGSKKGHAQLGGGRTVERTHAGNNVRAAAVIVRAGERIVQAAASFLAASEGGMTVRAPKLPGCAC